MGQWKSRPILRIYRPFGHWDAMGDGVSVAPFGRHG